MLDKQNGKPCREHEVKHVPMSLCKHLHYTFLKRVSALTSDKGPHMMSLACYYPGYLKPRRGEVAVKRKKFNKQLKVTDSLDIMSKEKSLLMKRYSVKFSATSPHNTIPVLPP